MTFFVQVYEHLELSSLKKEVIDALYELYDMKQILFPSISDDKKAKREMRTHGCFFFMKMHKSASKWFSYHSVFSTLNIFFHRK